MKSLVLCPIKPKNGAKEDGQQQQQQQQQPRKK